MPNVLGCGNDTVHLLLSKPNLQESDSIACAGLVHPATLCWICAGSVDKAVEYWSRESQGPGFTADALQVILEPPA